MAKKKKKSRKKANNQIQNDILKRLKQKFLKKEYIIIAGVLIFAFILRLIYISQLKANDPKFLHLEGTDQGSYDSAACDIINGTFPKQPYYYNPGYYYFLALVYLIFGHNYDIAITIQILIGIGTYLLTYLIAKELFNKNVALISLVLCILYGIFMVYEGLFLSTVLETFLLTLIIFLLIKWIYSFSYKRFLLIGIIIGLASLVRPTILLLIPFFLLWILIELIKERKKLIISISGILIGLIISIFPCTIRNYLCSSKFVLISSNGPINFWIGNNPDAIGTYYLSPYAEVLRDKMKEEGKELWLTDALSFIKERPYQWMRLLLKKFCLFWSSYEPPDNDVVYDRLKGYSSLLRLPFILTFGIIAPLGIAGIFFSIRRWWKKGMLLYLIIAGYSMAVILFFVQSRFRVAIVTSLILFAGFTLYYLYNKIVERKYLQLVFSLVVVIILYLLVNFQTYLGWTYPLFYHQGTVIESRNGIIIRDDSGEWHGEKTETLNSPEKIIKKELIIDEDISKINDAGLILHYFANDKGSLLIKVNDYAFPEIPCSRITYGKFMRFAKFGFNPAKLKKGINTITLRVTPEANVQILIDNWCHYGRSYLSSNGIDWVKTKGEYMVQLELISQIEEKE